MKRVAITAFIILGALALLPVLLTSCAPAVVQGPAGPTGATGPTGPVGPEGTGRATRTGGSGGAARTSGTY